MNAIPIRVIHRPSPQPVHGAVRIERLTLHRPVSGAEHLGGNRFQILGRDGTAALKAVGRGTGGEEDERKKQEEQEQTAHERPP
jgi:hypothetical protein